MLHLILDTLNITLNNAETHPTSWYLLKFKHFIGASYGHFTIGNTANSFYYDWLNYYSMPLNKGIL